MQTYQQLRLYLVAQLEAFLDPLEARSEASLWISEGLGRDRAWMAAHRTEPIPTEALAQIESWLERRRQGEPWAHLLGWCIFRKHRFDVSRDVLIPRPETELVLEAALDVGRRLNILHACDVGTGSGILAICLALETDWAITGSDLSAEALLVAQRNAQRLGAKVKFLQGNLLEPIPDPLGLVLANPPYVDPAAEPELQRELRFEPRTALFSEDRGMALGTEILRQARRRNAPAVVMEIGDRQGPEMKERALAQGWKRVLVHQDMAGFDRVLMAVS